MDFIPETQLGQLMPTKLETVGSRQVPKCSSELDIIKKKKKNLWLDIDVWKHSILTL